jgi:carbonic anhydrase
MKKLLTLCLGFAFCLLGSYFVAEAAPPAADVHWGYRGEAGPAHWGELDPSFAKCAEGQEQSPVDIPASAPVNTSGLAFHYQPSGLTILNNGHTVQVNYDKGSAITLEGTTYDLVQFHFHAPSEHTLAGQSAPMELHLVHRSADQTLAVVGVMIQRGGANPAYDALLNHLPAQEQAAMPVAGVTVDAASLLPADRSYYRYNGSLTTPPCSEGVKWQVLRTPVTLSDAQIAAFTKLYPNDARPVQPLNARTFLTVGSAPVGMPTTGHGEQALLLVLLSYAALGLIVAGVVLLQRKRT